jgi:GTP-binding protein
MSSENRFFDTADIFIASGNGGNGMVHFRREKFVPRGGPDGGDGGNGGSVYLVVDPHLNTLEKFRFTHRFQAEHAKHGGPVKRSGKSGEDLLIGVPAGTVIYDSETNEALGDLTESGQKLLVAKGGQGGRGNQHFANSRRQVPFIGEKGEPGQSRQLRLELKIIADVGIVGMPNAGKSTFLSVVTAAKPKIANYPFTTLVPNLGVAQLEGYHTLVLADIPGLIEGAHLGAGLGFEFLRHIQRTRVLIHLLDGTNENPLLDYSQIQSELALFDENLAEKPQVVVVNKLDMPETQARYPELRAIFAQRGIELHSMSAIAQLGVREVLYKASALLKDAPPAPVVEITPVYRAVADPGYFEVTQEEPHVFRIRGEKVERAARQTYWEFDDAVRRFQRILETLGVQTALRAAGVQPGDTIRIGENELEWQE